MTLYFMELVLLEYAELLQPPKWLMEQIYTEIKARLDKKII